MDLNVQITILDSSRSTAQSAELAGWREGRCGPEIPPTSRYVTLAVLAPICAQKYSRKPLVFWTLLAHRPSMAKKPHSLAEANVAISLAATGECSSCQCLSASALLVVFPVACPYSSSSVHVLSLTTHCKTVLEDCCELSVRAGSGLPPIWSLETL